MGSESFALPVRAEHMDLNDTEFQVLMNEAVAELFDAIILPAVTQRFAEHGIGEPIDDIKHGC
jgi:hypothetical protein